MDRRDFIKMLGIASVNTAAYAACSAYMQEALASSTVVEDMLSASVHCKEGSLADIEHVVILMQENRSFDHYFGTLRGVRGFGDPRPVKLKNGEPVWHQAQSDSSAQKVKPYQLPRGTMTDNEGAAGGVFLEDPAHDYKSGLAAWNGGLMDKWIPQKGIVSMAHYSEKDIPLYFKLAKAFTICDAYFCSHNGATDPNRSYFWTGTCNGKTSNDFFSGNKAADDDASRPNWKSYPERLQELGVDWKFYQDGLTKTDDAFAGNYGDNTLEYFKQFRVNKTRLGDKSSIYDKNQTINSILRTEANTRSQFEQDIIDNKLPEVSWIVAPEAFSEHPKYPPHFGEYYLHEILRALVANKEVWHKTALIVTYDENGGFFDHVLPPVPPIIFNGGKVSSGIILPPSEKPRSFDTECSVDGNTVIGMGMRVPTLIISPWSSGGRVCSEVFDHTSVIRFLDVWLKARGRQQKDMPIFPNISSWRQAIAGDLTSAFDFGRADVKPMDDLVDGMQPVKVFSSREREFARNTITFKPTISDVNADPDNGKPISAKQDREGCDLLPIGYDFQVLCSFTKTTPKRFELTFKNYGRLGAAFTVLAYDRNNSGWFFSLEGAKSDVSTAVTLSDVWYLKDSKAPGWGEGDYFYLVHGPNGYLAEFRGNAENPLQAAFPDFIDISPSADGKIMKFAFAMWPTANGKLKMINAYSGVETVISNGTKRVDVVTKDGWYDVSFVDAVNTDSKYLRRYAGHIETGKMSRTDPAIGMIYDEAARVYIPAVV
ncbi:phosphocholine-specific phospholipase C [uncultured Phyllobacterium sp.]|uniref:phosphocholine-specific phospholipase C n=1 Tax=uncultured Phyllobacterium sp. TaxID=253813 RepID=UPI00258A19C9|nr:phospholipase C, phosphocholine-specific [uncultured Phyllobacterium sp.]